MIADSDPCATPEMFYAPECIVRRRAMAGLPEIKDSFVGGGWKWAIAGAIGMILVRKIF